MMDATLKQFGLRARIAFARWGWVNCVAAVLCALGIVAFGFGLPRLRAQVIVQEGAMLRQRLTALAAPLPIPAQQRSASEQGLHDFYTTLGEQHYAEQQVKALFYAAAKNGLVLNQADYQATDDQNGRFRTYRIQVPLKGSYPAIRKFCEQVLLEIPFASLDEIQFKRESADNPQLEGNLRFTLYLNLRNGSGVRQEPEL